MKRSSLITTVLALSCVITLLASCNSPTDTEASTLPGGDNGITNVTTEPDVSDDVTTTESDVSDDVTTTESDVSNDVTTESDVSDDVTTKPEVSDDVTEEASDGEKTTSYNDEEITTETETEVEDTEVIDRPPSVGLEFDWLSLTIELDRDTLYYMVDDMGECVDTDVVIPETHNGNTVTAIGYQAFSSCSEMTSITIPNTVKIIQSDAFFACTGLTEINIPSSVVSIGNGAFFGCSNLKIIKVSNNNTVYHSDGNCLIETETKTLQLGCVNSVIPDDGSVTIIKESAFFNVSGMKTLTIPDSVTELEGAAIIFCMELKTVNLGSGIKKLGPAAFSNCTALTDINYNGTKAEWEAIDKAVNWTTGSVTIHCNDGDIVKN